MTAILRKPLCTLRAVIPSLAALVSAPIALAQDPPPPTVARQWDDQLLGAIRLNVPNPPAHARNIFHTAAAMYAAWAAYDPTAVGYIYNEKIPLTGMTPAQIEAARNEAISYAAYRVLYERFKPPPTPEDQDPQNTSTTNFTLKLTALGCSKATSTAPVTNDPTPSELGKRVARAILTWGASDAFASGVNYPQAYTDAVNPNMAKPLSVLGNNFYNVQDMPLGVGVPEGTNPSYWQPLALSAQTTQNGIAIPGGTQVFVGVQGMATTPFSLTRTDPLKPWIDPGGPSRLSTPGNPSPTDNKYKQQALAVVRASSQLNVETLVDRSPGAYGNNPLGTDDGAGHPKNPVTNADFTPNMVKLGDFVRVMAEFWADGPRSETPPGHWQVLASEVADDHELVKKIGGTGPVVSNLEWDVKAYFVVAAATHDAACAAWALKRYYSGMRPITMIRYMSAKGQSSDPNGPSYHTEGIPLEPGVVEVITKASSAPGQRHAKVWDVFTAGELDGELLIGQIAVYSWPGEHPGNKAAPSIADNQSLVRWQLGKDWLPFQRKTFNTPAFPGYISGHSTFSRAAAEALALLTGSPYFPGGFHEHRIAANTMQIDKGPSADVDLQWCTYYDAADQAGQSRRWGGIHPSEDDYDGRRTGAVCGKSAYALAAKYWDGSIVNDVIVPTISMVEGGKVKVTWNATRGMYHRVQHSPDLINWTGVGTAAIMAYDTNGSWTDETPAAGDKFYRVVRSLVP
ncbi:MAG TPA: hypothetical protein VG796_23790 [Verrucomicrobiales bacterium]|nr:hypothetical protein [Verrucomicrobiales bacterium]